MNSGDFWSQKIIGLKNEEAISSHERQGSLNREYSSIMTPHLMEYSFKFLDPQNIADLEDIHKLLEENYIEDQDCMFRFNYSKDFLSWALKPSGSHTTWNLALLDDDRIIGFVSAKSLKYCVKYDILNCAEINFLCLHKNYRSKRLVPFMINELVRITGLCGVYQGFYTTGAQLPSPFCISRYYHYPLNIEKLVEINFASESIFKLKNLFVNSKKVRDL